MYCLCVAGERDCKYYSKVLLGHTILEFLFFSCIIFEVWRSHRKEVIQDQGLIEDICGKNKHFLTKMVNQNIKEVWDITKNWLLLIVVNDIQQKVLYSNKNISKKLAKKISSSSIIFTCHKPPNQRVWINRVLLYFLSVWLKYSADQKNPQRNYKGFYFSFLILLKNGPVLGAEDFNCFGHRCLNRSNFSFLMP